MKHLSVWSLAPVFATEPRLTPKRLVKTKIGQLAVFPQSTQKWLSHESIDLHLGSAGNYFLPIVCVSARRFEVPDGVVIKRDLTFLPADRTKKLDLYRPATIEADQKLPAVVIIHGGGWAKGDKDRKREFVSGVALAKAGDIAISSNYETRKEKRWPGNLHD